MPSRLNGSAAAPRLPWPMSPTGRRLAKCGLWARSSSTAVASTRRPRKLGSDHGHPGSKRNRSGAAQLRLDAIDALETHYGTPRTHHPLDLAHASAAALLDWLGFSSVVGGQDETVTSSTPDTVAGYIL